jgi:anionic cell wall polymer biosynthesis LytR-Cps2A-Psr (LCP) family protein
MSYNKKLMPSSRSQFIVPPDELSSPKKKAVFRKKVMLFLGIGLATFLVILVIAIGTFLYGTYQRVSVHSFTKPAEPISQPADPHANEFHQGKPYSFLLLGYGGGGHQGGKLTDSMMIVHVIPQKQQIFLISLPRDIWVSLPTSADQQQYFKINAAYAIGSDDRGYPQKPAQFTGPAGGGELAKVTVEKVTGLPIQHFAALDFAGFKKTIDVLGGVNVKVEKTFDDDQYPIEGKEEDTCGFTPEDQQAMAATMSATVLEKAYTCRYETIHFEVGKVHMDGETALKFVRSRHSKQDGNDFGRSTRQRNVLVAVKERVLSLDFFPKIIPFVNSLSYDLQTDLRLGDMETFLRFKDELSSYQIFNIAISDQNVLFETRQNKQDVLIPKAGVDQWQSIHDWLTQQIETASVSATPSPKLQIKLPSATSTPASSSAKAPESLH